MEKEDITLILKKYKVKSISSSNLILSHQQIAKKNQEFKLWILVIRIFKIKKMFFNHLF